MPTMAPLPRYGLVVMLALILFVGCSSTGDSPTATPTSMPTATPTPMPGALDRDALVELYSATDGANWSSSSNWLSDAPIGEWLGVTTDANGRVTELFLEQNQLSGEIPPEFGNLTHLEWLFLSGNQLRGCVPAGLRDVPNSDLSGLGLPFCASPDRSALVALYNETGGPRWTYNDNWLSAMPIGEWRGVVMDRSGRVAELNLLRNQLRGEAPPELGNLTNLTNLELTGNKLSGEIPPELGNLANLTYLSLSGGFIHLPEDKLGGEIPPELGNLANLTYLSLSYNQLSGEIPPELGSLANLNELRLTDNQLSGEIPPELGSLVNLNELWLTFNQLSGEIPPELGNLTNLEGLFLGGNQLGGCIPAGLRDIPISDLSELGLPFCASADRDALVALYNETGGSRWAYNDNWLSDMPIGEWRGVVMDRSGRVAELNLSNNQLSGKIPPELGSLANLESLILDGNQLSGCIPGSLQGQLDMESSDLGGLPFCIGLGEQAEGAR